MNRKPEITVRLKAHLRRAMPRLTIMQDKMRAVAKIQRKELAKLIESGKLASANLKAELLILDDKKLELLEILELHCTLLLARVGMLDRIQQDPRLVEAVCAITVSCGFVDLKEMNTIAEDLRFYLHLIHEDLGGFDDMQNRLPPKLKDLMSSDAPPESLILQVMHEIANAYDIRAPGISEAAEAFNKGLKPKTDLEKASSDLQNNATDAEKAMTGDDNLPEKGAAPDRQPMSPDDLVARFAALKRKS